MNESDLLLMSAVIFVPTAFALLLAFFPKGSDDWMKWFTLLGSAVTVFLSIVLFIDFQQGVLSFHTSNPEKSQLSHRAYDDLTRQANNESKSSQDQVGRTPWIKRFGIEYFLGVDGISMPLILMTTILSFLAVMASWGINKHVRAYCMLFLLLETGMIGTFLALDFFLFFIFWEIMLLPMYFLIGVWGGPRREYAAIKFFLYTMLGSVFILIAMLAFYFTDVRDFVHPQTVKDRTAELSKTMSPYDAANASDIHSFDLMVLHKAGVAALRLLQGEDVEKVARQVVTESERMTLTDEQRKLLALTDKELAPIDLEKEKDPEKRKAIEAENKRKAELREKRDEVKRDLDAVIAARVPGAVERLKSEKFFGKEFQITMFLLLFVGFAIKVPVFPFHTWLPDAHVEAPTPISMILAGVLLKLGGYGILRICYPICPWAAEYLAWYIALFGVINIVYGALAAMAQKDFKKLVAYSSVSHMGYVILGIAVWSAGDGNKYWSWGMNGAMFQMIAHGITSAGMFFLVGVIYDRAHHRNLDNFRGLNEPMPLFGGVSAIIFFAAMGLPGMCGFVGEFMVVLATWNFDKTFAILSALTVVLTAAYILWTMQRVYMGTNPAYKDYPDMNLREVLCILPLVVFAILLGVLPMLLTNVMESHVTGLVQILGQTRR